MKRFLKISSLILWMGLVFYFSNQTGAQSDGMSIGTLRTLGFFLNRLFGIEIDAFDISLNFLIRKAAHLFEYFVLFILAYENLKEYTDRNAALIAFIFCLVYAGFDEYHQLFIGGRTGQFRDCIIDGCGALTGLLFWHKLLKK